MDALGNPQSMVLLGGTSEIGRAIVDALASPRLTRVVLAGRPGTGLDQAMDDVATTHHGIAVTTAVLDVEDAATHDPALDAAFNDGDIDVVILAIGVLGDQGADEVDADAAARVMRINGADSSALALRAYQRLAQQGHGTLVVISTIAAVRPRRANFIYGASKAGLDAFTQGLIELGRESGVQVVLVRPGFVRTRMTEGMAEAPFTVDPSDVGRDVAQAVRKKRSIIYSPAQVAAVAGVLKALPRPVLRRLPR
jgi:decaprenylphospho-beta-D-erythro-pentofuranosid-2-ulose 2-reductase